MSCVLFLLSSGSPAAHFPFLFSHPGTDRLRGGGTTGVGAEVANAKTEKGGTDRRKEGLKSMREDNTTAAIHGGFTQQMRGEQISH